MGDGRARARAHPALTDARARLEGDGKAVLIVFGTGWGLAPSVVDGADALLEPVRAKQAITII